MSARLIFRYVTDSLNLVENEALSRVCDPSAWLLKYLVECTAARLQYIPADLRKYSSTII